MRILTILFVIQYYRVVITRSVKITFVIFLKLNIMEKIYFIRSISKGDEYSKIFSRATEYKIFCTAQKTNSGSKQFASV